jgi:hypothetical protein
MSLNTKAEIISYIKTNAKEIDFYKEIPEKFQTDTEILGLAVLKNMISLTDTLRDNVEMWKYVVEHSRYLSSSLLEEVSERLKDDEAFVELVLNKQIGNYKYASERIQNISKWAWKVTEEGYYQDVPEPTNRDHDMILRAFETHSQTFYHLPEDIRDNQEYIDLAMKHSLGDSVVFNSFPAKYKDDDDIAFKMVQKSGFCFRHVSDRLKANKDLALLSLQQDARNIGEMPEELQKDPEIVRAAFTGGSSFSMGPAIKNVPSELLEQRVFAELGSQTGQSLEYFPEWQDDRELVLQFTKKKIQNYQYVSARLKKDRTVVLSYVGHKHSWVQLNEVPKEFRNDEEIVELALIGNASNAKHMSKELLNNTEFIKKMTTTNSEILSYLPKDIGAQVMNSTIETEVYRNRIIQVTTVPDTNSYVQNSKRMVDEIKVKKEGETEVFIQNVPIIIYESDGPVGSYLSHRMLYNIVLCGDFTFLVGKNSGYETYSLHTKKGRYMCCAYSDNCTESNADFKNHHVKLLCPSTEPLSFTDVFDQSPVLYTGRKTDLLPTGIQIFEQTHDFSKIMTMLTQSKVKDTKRFVKKDKRTIQIKTTEQQKSIDGAAQIYVNGHGWRWLIPNPNGPAAALQRLQETTHDDDWNWFESKISSLESINKKLLIEHFQNTELSNKVKNACQ